MGKNVILNSFHNVLQVSIHRKNIKVSENCIIGNFASLLCTSFNEMLPSLLLLARKIQPREAEEE